MVELIGFLAGFFSIVSFLPQAIKSWKTKKTGDLSILTGISLIVASLLWIGYGLLLPSLPMITANVAVLILVLSIGLVGVLGRKK